MRERYIRHISIVRARGENNVPLPEADEVVVYRSFMKAGLLFPLDKLLVKVLKTFKIYLHQLTPEAIIKVGMFIWAMMSQGLEPNAKCLCNIHELPERGNITTTSVVTASCLALRQATQFPHFGRDGRGLDARMVLREE
jgi:hypothetical protein